MFETYLLLSSSINEMEEVNNSLCSIENTFSCIDYILSFISSLLIIIAGVYGIKYINKIKEKNNNAIFGYYTRLKVRLHIIKTVLEEYKMPFLDRLIPQSERSDIEPSKQGTVNLAIENLIENAKETLNFLKNSEEQMPASITWSDNYCTLLEFLEDCVKITNNNYFKWNTDFSNNQNVYYNRHKENIDLMIESISKQQEKMQIELYKTTNIAKLKSYIKKP